MQVKEFLTKIYFIMTKQCSMVHFKNKLVFKNYRPNNDVDVSFSIVLNRSTVHVKVPYSLILDTSVGSGADPGL